MKSLSVLLLFGLIVSCTRSSGDRNMPSNTNAPETLGRIEKLDDELGRVLNTAAEPEILGEGYEWTEGPVWVEEYGFLLFSDIPENTIYKWKEGEGVSEYLQPSGYTGTAERGGETGSNGLLISSEGDLFLAQHGDRQIARMNASFEEPEPSFISIAERYEGMRFNSPNDLVQHSSGSIYFTDPPYGLEENMDDPAKEIGFQGVYRIDPDGTVTLLTDELSRPNGIAFSPDENLLYVANSDPENPVWMVYDVQENGDIADGRIFYDATEEAEEDRGMPDGLKVNSEGYIFATGPGGVWIFSPDGKVLGKIRTGELISNCALDAEEATLYMTADSYLLRIQL